MPAALAVFVFLFFGILIPYLIGQVPDLDGMSGTILAFGSGVIGGLLVVKILDI